MVRQYLGLLVVAAACTGSQIPAPRIGVVSVRLLDGAGCQGASGASAVIIAPPHNDLSELAGVAAIGDTSAWAVGTRYTSPVGAGAFYTLVEHRDGTRWTHVVSPNLGSDGSSLLAVAAASANDAWAVGAIRDGLPLAEHWDGRRWSSMSVPTSSSRDTLRAVATVSRQNVWAVGDTANATALIDHWNGKNWLTVSSPRSNSALLGLAAVSSRDVWAVGWTRTWRQTTLVEHWDGSSWQVVPSANAGHDNELAAIAAISANNIWAVGDTYNYRTGQRDTLVEHWDGRHWTITPSPNSICKNNALLGIAALSPTDIWAVGIGRQRGDFSGATQPILTHWNGVRWGLASGPSLACGTACSGMYLSAIAAVSSHRIWAVGVAPIEGAIIGTTFAEQWDGHCWTIAHLSIQGVAMQPPCDSDKGNG